VGVLTLKESKLGREKEREGNKRLKKGRKK
jgi:hypothetical protein